MTDQPQGPTEPTPDEPTAVQPTPSEADQGAPGQAAPPPQQPTPVPPPAAPPAVPSQQPPPAAPQQVPPPVPPVVGGQSYVGNPGAYPGWTGPGQAYPQQPQAYPPPAQGYPQQGQAYAQGQGYPAAANVPPQGYGAPPANPYGGYTQAPVYAGGGGPAYPGSLAYVEQNYGKVADFGQRALAYLIDTAISLIGLIPLVIGIIVVSVGASNTFTTDEMGYTTTTGDYDPAYAVAGGLLITLGAVLVIAITLWNRVFKMGRTGQSVGKKVIGLYLLDDKTGRPIGAGMCFLRELVQSLVNQIFYLGWLWMLWDADKQTLGDKSVHSSVVVVPKS